MVFYFLLDKQSCIDFQMMNFFVFATLLTVTVAGAQERQLDGPENTLSFVGSTATLKCLSPTRNCSGVDWQKFTPGASPITIFKGPGTILNTIDRDRYSVDNSSGCDLIIKNVKLTDAGRYICSAIISSSQATKTAHLIILLETRPNCTLVMPWHELATGDEIQLNCELTYKGADRVSIVWRGTEDVPVYAGKGNVTNRFYFVVPSAPEAQSFTCIVTFAVKPDDNGVQIVGLATNTQKVTCGTPVVKVLSNSAAQHIRVEEPQNTLRIVGSTVTFKCLSPSRNCSGIEWLKYSAGSPTTVYNDYQGISLAYNGGRYSVDSSSSCNLIIRNVQLTDAGLFLCRAAISPRITFERAAYLAIFETQPTCSMYASLYDTVEGEGVQLNCMMAYNDRNTMSMVWNGVDDAPAGTKSGSNLIWSYHVVASVPEIPSFTCSSSITVQTKDSNGEPIIGLARNFPNVTCATSPIKVLHTVRDVQLSPSSSDYPPGSRILCMAKGYPAPTLQWQEMESESSWTAIKNLNSYEFSMTNVSHKRYRCVAMNVVRNKAYYATSHEFLVNTTESGDNDSLTATTMDPLPLPLMVSIAVGAVFGCLLFILPINCFFVPSCPGYNWWHSGKKTKDEIREEFPLSEDPDLYCNVDQLEDGLATVKPRSAAPTNETPCRPKLDLPRASNPKAGRSNP